MPVSRKHQPLPTLFPAARSRLGAVGRLAFYRCPAHLVAPLRTIKKYFYTFGLFPNLIAPKTFNEKVNVRKFFDHRPLFRTWVDKFAVRDWVAGIKPGYDRLLPKLYHVTTDPADIPFDRLPDRFVIKASHGSGWLRIVKDKALIDRAAVIAECRHWLASNYYDLNLEAVYKKYHAQAKLPLSLKILIENLHLTEDGVSVTEEHIAAVANWQASAEPTQ